METLTARLEEIKATNSAASEENKKHAEQMKAKVQSLLAENELCEGAVDELEGNKTRKRI